MCEEAGRESPACAARVNDYIQLRCLSGGLTPRQQSRAEPNERDSKSGSMCNGSDELRPGEKICAGCGEAHSSSRLGFFGVPLEVPSNHCAGGRRGLNTANVGRAGGCVSRCSTWEPMQAGELYEEQYPARRKMNISPFLYENSLFLARCRRGVGGRLRPLQFDLSDRGTIG